ncbi:MAG TPA: FlgD immunoglobulin-like domain containing protein [Polyangiales bacterium]|nr:FlgD immunoglobulin-like domain containing protein [Polyangiales bacterium]
MTVAATSTTNQTAQSSQTQDPAPVNPSSDMGSDTFLKLLVAQLQNQDPMSPMQSQDMVAQLAQLSSVQKLSDVDDKLTQLQTINTTGNTMQSTGLIGKTITADTSKLDLGDTGSANAQYQLGQAAASVNVNVRDSNGSVVRTMTLEAAAAGQQKFTWDGNSDAGTRAATGSYTFDVTAKNTQGSPVSASTEASGLVTEVTYENGAPEVVVGGAHIPLADVTSIAQ